MLTSAQTNKSLKLKVNIQLFSYLVSVQSSGVQSSKLVFFAEILTLNLQTLNFEQIIVKEMPNIYSEIVSDAIDNINSMKPIVSGDTINAEFKYHTAHPFVNFARMFFSANELPEIEEKTFSALKRIRLTKWEQKFLRKPEYNTPL